MRQLVLPRTQPVADLALSPDGRTLAVAHRNYGVLLYDPFDGRVKLEARGYFTRVTFREDGRWLAAMGGWAALVNMGESAPSILYPSNPAPTLAYGAHFDADDRVTFLTDNIKTHRLPPVNRATEGLVLEEEQEYAAVAYSRHRLGWGVGPKRQVVGLEYGLRAYRGVVFDLATGAVIALVEMPYARETFFRSRAD